MLFHGPLLYMQKFLWNKKKTTKKTITVSHRAAALWLDDTVPIHVRVIRFVKSLEIWAMNIEHAHRHTQYCHHNHTLWLNTDINAPHYKLMFTTVCHNKHFQDEFWTHLRARNNHLHTDHDRTVHGIPIWHVYLCNIQQQLAEQTGAASTNKTVTESDNRTQV